MRLTRMSKLSSGSTNLVTRLVRRIGGAAVIGVFALSTGAFAPHQTRADQGMWLLHALDKCPYDGWRAKGLALSKEELYSPQAPDVSDAVVKLGGGTGSFVSPDGLMLTNHHVAFGALQRQSSVKANYIQDGFLARSRIEEIPALGYEAHVLIGVENVTKKVLGALSDKMSDRERFKAIERIEKELVKKAEKGKDVEADVAEFFGGAEYYLFTYFKIKDIRIVYAPPASIGVFGGDVDNWMWPRHTGDFSFLRAYVASDGKSADYSESNVPYRPERYLAISRTPIREGDFTMVIGYPGSTRRYQTSYSIDHYVNAYYPTAIERYEDLLRILEEESNKSPETAIKLASTVRGFSNSYKNNKGMLEGLNKSGLLDKKREEEKTLRAYIAADPQLARRYGNVLDEIRRQYRDYDTYWEQASILGWVGYASTAMGSAYTIYKWSLEQEKKDIDRDPGYMDRDAPRLKKRLELADYRYDANADKRLLGYFLTKAAMLPKERHIAVVASICEGRMGSDEINEAIDEFVDELYANTKVTDKEARMKMFGMKKKDLLALNDPLINFAAQIEVEKKKLEERSDAFEGALQKLRPRLMEIRTRFETGALYPDANRTKRLSVGEVKGYAPRDAVRYDHLTTLKGVIEKYTGEAPFDVPARLFELYHGKDFGVYADPATADVPVCFLSTDDVTGGNSGSPILNGRGDVIGLVFDGNYESISADYQFIPDLTRTINVDSRYILFILDKFAGANELMNELTVR